MEREIFRQRLGEASERAVAWAREHVSNPLPADCLFLLYPNQSDDRDPPRGDEETFPEESLPDGNFLGPLSAEEVVGRLWRNGKVPEWVNVAVKACDARRTYLALLCCGRFTAREDLLYFASEGHAPFHVTSPDLPPRWRSVEESGKFDLYWRGQDPPAGV
ncbi:MAG TPA: hypothetical protein VGV38_21530 [Pyrinomonadaceae bacterium]|nr:hypothetical protein [Pyrinomonadaceae bacterium]